MLDTARTAGQQTLTAAATTALAGTPADVRALLARTQAYRQQRDDVVAIARVQIEARTNKQENLANAAEEALAGPATGIRDFLDRSQYLALAKDQVTVAHVASVEHFLTLACEASALAAGEAADAWKLRTGAGPSASGIHRVRFWPTRATGNGRATGREADPQPGQVDVEQHGHHRVAAGEFDHPKTTSTVSSASIATCRTEPGSQRRLLRVKSSRK